MSLNAELTRSLEEKSKWVDAELEKFLKADALQIPNLHDGMLYALGLDQDDPKVRGKRIRPALCLLSCEALDGPVDQALPFAMAIELMHNFFLVHDDIQDGDISRRGRPSVWKHYGINHAINIGDFLFNKVFSVMTAALRGDSDMVLHGRLWKLLVETLERTHVGQALDMNALESREFSLDDYMRIVTNKTGYYLAAPMLGGAMVAGADDATLEAIRKLGKCVGPVFQIVDDTIDLTHGKGRESVGSDIREGKRSYLIACVLERASKDECAELIRVLDLPREETSAKLIEWVKALFDHYGVIEAGREYCQELMQQGRAAMEDAPENLRRTLLAVFDDLLDRKR
ncbi:MAG: polyprenyl synthetase family protein [Candidatus Sumerlaeia bacterium]